MENIWNDITAIAGMSWQVVLLRLGGAVLFCGLIGFERESQNRPAGLRTHMMVGLAAALYCLIMQELLQDSGEYSDRVAMDPLRLIEAVTSGVAFLAAGMIVFSQGKVHGLMTGTSLWLAAAIGLSAGFGMWLLAGMTTILALIIIRLVKVAEEMASGKEREGDAKPVSGD
jgi:putative Mg2+ transporter-C (MgtC) family protein